jgi:hypothetical protein
MSGILRLGLGHDAPIGADPGFRLDVGSVVWRSFDVWAANLLPFSLVGLVVYLPVFLLIWLLDGLEGMTPANQQLIRFVTSVMTILLSGAVTYGVFRHLRGERAGVGEVLRGGASSFLAVLLTGTLFMLAVGSGLVCLVIPGLVLMARYWVAVPVAVIEAPGAMASLNRSEDLTEGNRGRVFAVVLLMMLAMIVAAFVVVFALGVLVAPRAEAAAGTPHAVTPALALALSLLLKIPFQVLTSIAPVIVYHDLRGGREGANVDELLEVFA